MALRQRITKFTSTDKNHGGTHIWQRAVPSSPAMQSSVCSFWQHNKWMCHSSGWPWRELLQLSSYLLQHSPGPQHQDEVKKNICKTVGQRRHWETAVPKTALRNSCDRPREIQPGLMQHSCCKAFTFYTFVTVHSLGLAWSTSTSTEVLTNMYVYIVGL